MVCRVYSPSRLFILVMFTYIVTSPIPLISSSSIVASGDDSYVERPPGVPDDPRRGHRWMSQLLSMPATKTPHDLDKPLAGSKSFHGESNDKENDDVYSGNVLTPELVYYIDVDSLLPTHTSRRESLRDERGTGRTSSLSKTPNLYSSFGGRPRSEVCC